MLYQLSYFSVSANNSALCFVLLTKIQNFKESGKRDSNSRPQPWQGCALPTELFPRFCETRHFRLCSFCESKLSHSLARKFRIVFRLTGAKVVLFFKLAKLFECFFMIICANELFDSKYHFFMFEDIVTCLPVFYKFIYHKNDEGSSPRHFYDIVTLPLMASLLTTPHSPSFHRLR